MNEHPEGPPLSEATAVASTDDRPGARADEAAPAAVEPQLPTSGWRPPERRVGERFQFVAHGPEILFVLALLFVIGASVAGAVNLGSFSGLTAFGRQNEISARARTVLLLWMGGSGAALAAGGLVALLIGGRTESRLALVAAWARLGSPLSLAMALPFLFRFRIWEGRELPLVLSATIVTLLFERSLWTSLTSATRALPSRLLELRVPTALNRLPPIVLAAAVAAVAVYFAYFTILNHHRLQTSSYDLAIFDNMMWNLLHGNGFKASPEVGRVGSHLGVHANFLAVIFVPLYALRPGCEPLLVIQAVVVSAAAIPLYLLARRRLGSAWQALPIAIAYLLFAPIHAAVFYDFHFLTLAPFFVLWVLYLFEAEHRALLLIAFVAALLLREDQGAVLSAVGLFYFFERRRVSWALIGALVAAGYAAVTKLVVMPRLFHGGGESFTWMYGGLIGPGESGFAGVLRTFASNPLFLLATVADGERLVYLLKIFGPVVLLPLRHRAAWILFLPAALFTVWSTHRPLYEPYFQYVCNWASVLFFAAVVVIARRKPGAVRVGTVLALFVASLVFSYNYGALLQRRSFRAGFRKIEFRWTEADSRRLSQLRAVIRHLPQGASVAASETEAPHVSTREDCFTLRYMHGDADYLLVSAEAMDPGTRAHFRGALATGLYGLVALEGPFTLWRRGSDKARNPEGLRLLGEPIP